MPKPTRPLSQRITDRLLGVSRRKRRVAYYAIGAGLGMLRPALRRIAFSTTTAFLALVVWRGLL